MDLLQTLGLGEKPSEENAVSTAIYVSPAGDHAVSAASDLEALRLELMQSMLPFLRGYVWHKDAFELQCSSSQQPPWARQRRKQGKTQQPQVQQLPCLWSITHVGDNIEDEWVVVALVLQLSARRPDLCIQVWDNDGDFLLIEAAYTLPRWLKPEVAANRVWIKSGHLHIIPQPSPSCPDLPAFPSLSQALDLLRNPPRGLQTEAPKVEAAIQARLGGLPDSALSQVHSAEARLPLRLAVALRRDPQLIAAAVEAFFYRDADDMRAAARMTHFPLRNTTIPTTAPTASPNPNTPSTSGTPSGVHLVTSLVRMSRCQHAQLLQQRFAAPRGLPMPCPIQQPEEHRVAELGLKITSGFEILWARAARTGSLPGQVAKAAAEARGATEAAETTAGADEGAAATASSSSSAATGAGASAVPPGCLTEKQLQGIPAWMAYLASLTRSGYFEGNIVGSARHKELLARAMQDFCQSPLLPRSTQQLADPVMRALMAVEAAEAEAAAEAAAAAAAGGAAGVGELGSGGGAAGGAGLERWLEVREAEARRLFQGPSSARESEEWSRAQEAALDEELAKRQQELEGYASKRMQEDRAAGKKAAGKQPPKGKGEVEEDGEVPETVLEAADLVGRFSQFMSAMSGHEGAELPDTERPVAMDAQKLLAQLKRTLGMEDGDEEEEEEEEDGSEEGSSFFSDDGDEDDEDEEEDEEGESAFSRELERQLEEGLWRGPAAAAARAGPGKAPLDVELAEVGVSSSGSGAAGTGTSGAARPGGGKGSRKLQELQEAYGGVETETDSDDSGCDLDLGSDDEEEDEGPEGGEEGQQEEAGPTGRGRGGAAGGGAARAGGFMDLYSSVLEQQLASTSMAETFERSRPEGAAAAAAHSKEEEEEEESGNGQPEKQAAAAAPLQPVDLDMNLVKNLLRSAAAQGGLAGPASNLAGMLGLELPQGMDEEQVGKL